MAETAPSGSPETLPAVDFADSIEALRPSFDRHLRAEGKRPKTVRVYLAAVDVLDRFLRSKGMPTRLPAIRREHVEAFLVDRREKPGRDGTPMKSTTLSIEFRALQQFFKWAVEEDEITASPMERMKGPRVEENPPAVLGEDQLRKMIAACEGREFADRRDMALVMLFADTGMRLGEMAGLMLEDLDLDSGHLFVAAETSKSRRGRPVAIGPKVGRALDRYLRSRSAHPSSRDRVEDRGRLGRPLWLGKAGPMTASGIAQAIAERSKAAGIGRVHPHQFRHSWAHMMLSAGAQEGDVQKLGGWKSRQMLSRYGAAAAEERALAAHGRFSPVERL